MKASRYFIFISAITFQVLFLSLNAHTAALEDTYLQTRDGFIQKFTTLKSPAAEEHNRALRVLESYLQSIIGPSGVKGFSGEGAISLETLEKDEAGFNQVDGLRFDSLEKCLFITTRHLLLQYINANEDLPKDLHSLPANGTFLSRVFDWDSAFTHFVEVPIKITHGFEVAKAALFLNAQDIGPFAPTTLIVFTANKNRVFLLKSDAKVDQIRSCKNRWDGFEKRSLKAFNQYRSSQLTDKKSFEEHVRLEDEGFEAYRCCFEKGIKKKKAFSRVQQQAQSIVDQLWRAAVE